MLCVAAMCLHGGVGLAVDAAEGGVCDVDGGGASEVGVHRPKQIFLVKQKRGGGPEIIAANLETILPISTGPSAASLETWPRSQSIHGVQRSAGWQTGRALSRRPRFFARDRPPQHGSHCSTEDIVGSFVVVRGDAYLGALVVRN